jgi:hypothetical protein
MKNYNDCQKTECKNCNIEGCYCKNPIYEEPSKVHQKEKKVLPELKITPNFHSPRKVRT